MAVHANAEVSDSCRLITVPRTQSWIAAGFTIVAGVGITAFAVTQDVNGLHPWVGYGLATSLIVGGAVAIGLMTRSLRQAQNVWRHGERCHAQIIESTPILGAETVVGARIRFHLELSAGDELEIDHTCGRATCIDLLALEGQSVSASISADHETCVLRRELSPRFVDSWP